MLNTYFFIDKRPKMSYLCKRKHETITNKQTQQTNKPSAAKRGNGLEAKTCEAWQQKRKVTTSAAQVHWVVWRPDIHEST